MKLAATVVVVVVALVVLRARGWTFTMPRITPPAAAPTPPERVL